MSEMSAVSLLTNELCNYWRVLLGDAINSNIEILQSDAGKKIKEEMEKTYTKISLTNLTQDRHLLAVTGLQGAGKTSLIKSLYELDDQYLPENISRGEKIPVLITEYPIKEPQGLIYYFQYEEMNGVSIKKEIVDSETFNAIAKNPENKHIWLELQVPNRFFNDYRKSIILLPGFEKDKKERSQQFLEHVLYLSTSSIVVFRKDTYARDASEKMFNMVQDIYRNVKPIFVLSHGDVNKEQNGPMKTQMMSDFNISPQESDRIIVSGDKTFHEAWQDQLLETISNYGFISDAAEKQKAKMLEKLFQDVMNQINELEELLKKHEINTINETNGLMTNDSTYRIINKFERMYEKMLKELEQDIKDVFKGRIDGSKKKFNEFVQANTGLWPNLKKQFVSSALKDQEKFEKAIKDSWIHANELKPEHVISNIVTHHINEHSKNTNGLLDAAPSQEFIQEGLGNDSIESTDLVPLSQMNSLQKINAYFEKDQNALVTLERDELKTMVVVGAMLGRQALVAQPLLENAAKGQNGLKFNDHEVTSAQQSIEDIIAFKDGVAQLKEVTPEILKSIPIILGIDIAADGEADILTNTTTALASLGIKLTSVQLIGLLGTGFLVTYGVNAVKEAVHETNKRQLQLAHAGYQAIEQLPELQTVAYINSLRRVFEKMSYRLYEVHSEKLGKFDNDGELEKLQYTIRRIRKTNGTLQKMVFNYAFA